MFHSFFLLLVSSLLCTQLFAASVCQITRDCFEIDGELINIESRAQREFKKIEDCDLNPLSCSEELIQSYHPKLTDKDFQKMVPSSSLEFFIPVDLKSQDAKLLLGALSLGTVVFANDAKIIEFVQNNQTATTEKIETFGNLMGREAILPIAAGSYFLGAVLDNGKLKNVGIFTVATGLATQLVTEIFKSTFKRKRPRDSEGPYEFFAEGNKSFFSGHSSGAFSLATVISEIYKDQPLVPYLAYGVAAVSAYARMHDNAHFASDVLLGAVAGHLITKIIIRSYVKKDDERIKGFKVWPVFGRDRENQLTFGVEAKYEWGQKQPSPLPACLNLGLSEHQLLAACVEEAFDK